ncbi:hypothetical protein HMPREF1568_0885 [Providencia alcalifaciens PAL-3]|nr:hypothetical protein HMPREF1568_0885 [Providencia alcalifaciens PAL-3]EUD00857.1 hypothetical protein HMPREF1566_3475 [Providencia alcalifaciens PAL-1]
MDGTLSKIPPFAVKLKIKFAIPVFVWLNTSTGLEVQTYL